MVFDADLMELLRLEVCEAIFCSWETEFEVKISLFVEG